MPKSNVKADAMDRDTVNYLPGQMCPETRKSLRTIQPCTVVRLIERCVQNLQRELPVGDGFLT